MNRTWHRYSCLCLLRAFYWAAPPLVCLWVYWLGLKTWFHQDDFAWLQLRLEVHSLSDFWRALLAPMAQGTIRPFSERLFFMGFSAAFGVNPLPFRIWVFLTQFGSLALVCAVTRRLTGSRLAGFAAPMLWTANAALATPMTWCSAYNQILCGFMLLASFYLLLRCIETGRLRYWVAQWAVFLAGFGVLEVNIVYPVLAAAYTLAAARRHFLKVLPLLAPSLAYLWIHQKVAPLASAGVYGLHLDAGMLGTLRRYWKWALGPALPGALAPQPAWVVTGASWLLSGALAGFVCWKLWRRRQWLVAFPLAWFLVVIAPVLPLREHVSDYYLAAPLAGLAMLGAWALAEALSGRWWWKVAGVAVAGVYLTFSVPQARASTRWRYDRAREAGNLYRGVARAHELHPRKAILLTDVGDSLFWMGVFDQPFRLFGADDVYLAPGSERGIGARPESGEISDFILPARIAVEALQQGRAVVYQAGGERLRNVTRITQALAEKVWGMEEPRNVDAGNALYAGQLGAGWFDSDGRIRWMSKHAAVRLGGPQRPGEKLSLRGYCPAGLVAQGPVKLAAAIDGESVFSASLSSGDQLFELSFALPASAVGKASIQVSLEVERTFTPPGETRALGLVFGTFRVQ